MAAVAQMKSKPPVITQVELDEAVRTNAVLKEVQAKRDTLYAAIKAKLNEGAELPTGGPWLLVQEFQTQPPSYKDQLDRVLEFLGSRLRRAAYALIERMVREESREVVRLVPRPNPDYEVNASQKRTR